MDAHSDLSLPIVGLPLCSWLLLCKWSCRQAVVSWAGWLSLGAILLQGFHSPLPLLFLPFWHSNYSRTNYQAIPQNFVNFSIDIYPVAISSSSFIPVSNFSCEHPWSSSHLSHDQFSGSFLSSSWNWFFVQVVAYAGTDIPWIDPRFWLGWCDCWSLTIVLGFEAIWSCFVC